MAKLKVKNVIIRICHKENPQGLDTLKKQLEAEGVIVIDSWQKQNFAFNHVAIERTLYLLEETLFLTDDFTFCREARENWGFVTVYLHENNRQWDFSDIGYVIEGFEEFTATDIDRIFRRYAKIPWSILETERLKVREITVKDVDALYEIYKGASVTKYTNSLYENKEDEIAYTKNYIEKVYPFFGFGMWIVIEKESGKIIGRAGFNFREGYDGMELGYVIGEHYQHKGYATEVCTAIVQYVIEEFQTTAIRALTDQRNEASVRVCEKLGMHHAGNVEIEGKVLEQYLL